MIHLDLRQEMDEADDVREVEDFDADEEHSLTNSMSQLTTREGGDATQPDDEYGQVGSLFLYVSCCSESFKLLLALCVE